MLRLRRDLVLPAAAPVLAVRAARRAVAADPADPEAYLALAEAYLMLWKQQEEIWSGRPPWWQYCFRDLHPSQPMVMLQTLREVQVVTALNRAVTLQPSLVRAHKLLGDVYIQFSYLDLALHHYKEALTQMRSRDRRPKRQPNESAESFRQRVEVYNKALEDMANSEKSVKALQADVDHRRRDYRLLAANQSLKQKIRVALFDEYKEGRTDWKPQWGRALADEALKLLLNAKPTEVNRDMAVLQLNLLLTAGRSAEVRRRMPDLIRALGTLEKQVQKRPQLASEKTLLETEIAGLKALQAAADGDYQLADAALARFEEIMMTLEPRRALEDQGRWLMMQILGAYSLRPQRILGYVLEGNLNISMGRPREGIIVALRRQAETNLIRGLLALEQGDTPRAAGFFQATLRLSQDLGPQKGNYTDRFVAAHYLQAIQKPGMPVLEASVIGLLAAPPGKGSLLAYGSLFPGSGEVAASTRFPGSTGPVVAALFPGQAVKTAAKRER